MTVVASTAVFSATANNVRSMHPIVSRRNINFYYLLNDGRDQPHYTLALFFNPHGEFGTENKYAALQLI